MSKLNNKCNYYQLDLLKNAVESGIISLDDVHGRIMASKRDQVKDLHPFAITPPSGKNTRWQTYYKDADGKRKIIRAQTEQELLDKLVPIYFSQMNLDKKTFHELFLEWLEYKKVITNSPNTIKRHIQHYNKYLESTVLHGKKIKQIDELLLEQECNRIVKEFNLSSKEWTNVKTILKGMYEYAVRKNYLDKNLIENVKITIKFRQIVKKTGKTETYNTEELQQLNDYLDGMFAETNDSVFLAVKLNFLLGLRVGELVTLKWEDICDLCTESTHKMRKTYASLLNSHGIPLDCIREQLEHSNLQTTLTYIFNPLTEKETYDMISSAL